MTIEILHLGRFVCDDDYLLQSRIFQIKIKNIENVGPINIHRSFNYFFADKGLFTY